MKKGKLSDFSTPKTRPKQRSNLLDLGSHLLPFIKKIYENVRSKVNQKLLTSFVVSEKIKFKRSHHSNCSKKIANSCMADYEAWRDRFLMNRLYLALWIGVIFVASMCGLFFCTAIFEPEAFKISYLLCSGAIELGLLTCLLLHKTNIGRRYPALLFLGFCWSLTVVTQTWVALAGSTKLMIPLWTMVFLTQATLMPVRWRLHLVSQISAFTYYLVINLTLGLTFSEPPLAYAIGYVFLFWVWFICDLSVYLYERLHKAEFKGRKELEYAYQKLEAAEAKYRSIFENAGEGIFQSSPEGCYITANPALAKIYGYDLPEEVTTYFTDIEHQLYVEPDRRAEFIKLMRENGAVSNFESQIYRKDGSIVWICENAREVRDRNGNLLYYEGLIEDITKRKRAEESLRVFFHAVSHDLRNPVTGMLMVLKNLESQSGEAISLSRNVLQRMTQSCDRQLQLINSLLEAHACEVRGIVCDRKPTQLSELIKDIEADFQPLLSKNQAKLINLVSEDLPIVNVDIFQLRRVLENLISNAIKHNPPGLNLKIAVNVEHDSLKCTLEDNGIGMSQEQCDRLFDLYFRGTQSRHSSGLGLGLYLCKQIINAHTGEIGVVSKPGEGSIFWFSLPFK